MIEHLKRLAWIWGKERKPERDEAPGMTEQEIRDQGWAIDLPFESGSADPERLEYQDFDDPTMKFDKSKFPDWKPVIPPPEGSEED